jgi:hypothetical protein
MNNTDTHITKWHGLWYYDDGINPRFRAKTKRELLELLEVGGDMNELPSVKAVRTALDKEHRERIGL